DDGGRPFEEFLQDRVRRGLRVPVQRPGDAQHGDLTGVRPDAPDLFLRPLTGESEALPVFTAEEFGGVRHTEHRLDPDAEPPDLPAALPRNAHAQNGVHAFDRHRASLIRAVQALIGEDDADLSAHLVLQLVGTVLDQLVYLPVPVTALLDPALPIGVLLNEPG